MDIRLFEPLWGQWTIEKLIGCGSFGRTWVVSNRQGNVIQHSAVKEIAITYSASSLKAAYVRGFDELGAKYYYESMVQTALTEIETVHKLDKCMYIVPINDYCIKEVCNNDENGWIILIRMELLQPLEALVNARSLSITDIMRIGIDICSALEACAARGIMHRDLNINNVFYSDIDKNFKLGDFGLAVFEADAANKISQTATFSYMSPNVFRGMPYTHLDDVYSLGMLLYCLLNDNRIPFLPNFPKEFSVKQRERAILRRLNGAKTPTPHSSVFSGSVVEELSRIVQKAIEPDLHDRFTSAIDLRKSIEHICM